MLLVQKLKQKVLSLSRRVRTMAKRLRRCEGSSSRKQNRHVVALRKHLGKKGTRAGTHQYMKPPAVSPSGDDCLLIQIRGLSELEELSVPQGTNVGQIKAWLRAREWNVNETVFRNMLRLSDTSLVFSGDTLVFRTSLRAGSPKGRIPWETTATTTGAKPLVAVQLDKQNVKIINVDNLHQGSRGAVLATIASWVRHSELRDSQEMVWIFPGNCSNLLRQHGANPEHISARQMLLVSSVEETAIRRNVTVLFLGKAEVSLDTGLDIVNVATTKGTELFIELDPRWAEPNIIKSVEADWRLQAPVLVSAALQSTVTQSEMFAFRQPGPTTSCWTARLHASQENALKLLASSGQKSLFIRPAQPDAEEWKKMWTIVWSNLQDVGETTLLSVLLNHAEKHAGHIGIAKAKMNLGLRVPWSSVSAARAALRPHDHGLNVDNRALQDDKTFKITGVPRGALPSEVVDACKQMSWPIIAQARLPAKQGRGDEWWISAAMEPPKRQFLWNNQHILVVDATEEEIRRARRPDLKKKPNKEVNAKKGEMPDKDPLQKADPWMTFQSTRTTAAMSAPSSSSSPASTSLPRTTLGANVTSSTIDPRVTALSQRVERLESETKELHVKVDTVDTKVDQVGVSMSTQFTEVLRLLGNLNDRKRRADSPS